MKTSRIARETVDKDSQTEAFSRRQTRSFAASLRAFSAQGASESPQDPSDLTPRLGDHSGDDESPLSSVSSAAFDIEDFPKQTSPARKRRREVGFRSTTICTTISTHTITQSSPLGAPDAKIKDGKARKAWRQPAQKTVNELGEVEIHPPANWQEVYDAVKDMRKTVLAPVDTMGCERLAEEHVSPRDKRFQTLIALMLSSQTKDTTNALAMRRLQTELPTPGLTLENILEVDSVRLNELIYAVGFHNNKTRYIKSTALILRDKFGGDIPDTVEGLTSLPGVGPKMAYLCLSVAWGRTEGIGVDVHVHRITNLWGWHQTKGPEETRAALEVWLPREKWHEINHLLVGFGQTICMPVRRKCEDCTLSSSGLCPSAVVGRNRAAVVKKVKTEASVAEHRHNYR